jgi:hypothetical protein
MATRGKTRLQQRVNHQLSKTAVVHQQRRTKVQFASPSLDFVEHCIAFSYSCHGCCCWLVSRPASCTLIQILPMPPNQHLEVNSNALGADATACDGGRMGGKSKMLE